VLTEELQRLQATLTFGPEFRYWVLFCGLFSPERNPVRHWVEHEKAFMELVR